ncbi:MAG TPA: hypothetical protein VIY73_19500, partial [Polyangiaceae bacterium]
MNKTLAVLKLPTDGATLLRVADAIVGAMTGNPHFPDPTPALATVAVALSELDAAQVATWSRARGTAAVRNEKRVVVVGLLMRLKAYVQGVADENPDEAASIIESAGMSVKSKVLPVKPPFAVRAGRVSGSVRLDVRAAAHIAKYEWEWTDDGGATWHGVPPTMQAKTVIAGLEEGV